jgi:formylglycine-generating enzyme required for sulfatase activity
MGTNDKESFPNERPAHLVDVRGFWMDEHDVTNAEFANFVKATGYVTTAERPVNREDLRKELPPGTPKPDDGALAPGSLVFTPTSGPVPSARRGTPPDTGSSHTGFRCVVSGDNAKVTRSVGGEPSLAE